MIVKIPFSEIERVSIYLNRSKKSVSDIKKATEADYVLNGTLYDMGTFQPVCHLRTYGETVCQPPYTTYGYAWDELPELEVIPSNRKNHIACVTMLRDGTKQAMRYDAALGGKRGRSAMGRTADSLVLLCTKDGGSEAMTPEELQDELVRMGCMDAVMLDGGGSSQCDFDGKTITSTRRVQNLILVYLRKEKTMKKVMLDPGHDAGNVNGSPDGTYKEHEFALDMGKRIKAILEKAGVAVSMTRTDGSEVSLNERCRMANAIKDLDLYVSLHSNAADSSGQWSSARGWSAHIVAKGGNAEKAAKAILKRVQAAGVAVRSQSIVVDNLQVLRDTVAPAVLIEHGFHTNEQDVSLLKDSQYRQALASAEALGILDHLGLSLPAEPAEGAPDKAADWADEAWELAYKLGILDGTRPGDPVTRQELGVVLQRLGLLDKLMEV